MPQNNIGCFLQLGGRQGEISAELQVLLLCRLVSCVEEDKAATT